MYTELNVVKELNIIYIPVIPDTKPTTCIYLFVNILLFYKFNKKRCKYLVIDTLKTLTRSPLQALLSVSLKLRSSRELSSGAQVNLGLTSTYNTHTGIAGYIRATTVVGA